MPTANGYNIGSDSKVVVIGPNGRIDMKLVTEFEVKQQTKAVKVEPLNGPPLQDEIPRGWDGSFSIDRASAALDTYFSQTEAAFYSGAVLPNATMFQTINEYTGTSVPSQSQWRYDNVSLKLIDAGSYKAADAVKQKVQFFASRRTRIS